MKKLTQAEKPVLASEIVRYLLDPACADAVSQYNALGSELISIIKSHPDSESTAYTINAERSSEHDGKIFLRILVGGMPELMSDGSISGPRVSCMFAWSQ